MKPELMVILAIFAGFIILEIIFTDFWKKHGQQRKDAIVEFVGSTVLVGITQPLVIFSAIGIMGVLFPQFRDVLKDIPFTLGFALFLVFDDMTQYLWHRFAHSNPLLYHLHRPHHDAPYMSIRIVYRNNIFFYAIMPGIWFSGVLIYLGLGWVYTVYVVIKMTVIYGAHSDVRWDEPLYKIKWLSPVMWLVERVISTPATHSAHHGKYKDDGITNYKGNYGNLLFFWDVLYGTAKITRKYPKEYGVENLPEAGIAEQLLWPLVPANKE